MLFARRWLILAIVSSALLLIVVDITVLYTALPALTLDLDASPEQKLWIINAYQLVAAGLLLPMGILGDRYGHRRLFLLGLLVFGVSSLLAAFAPTAATLIAARVGLAVGAAMMMPATLALIRQSFTDEKERTMAIGLWASVSGGGMAIGPVIGGVILEYFWWGAVFLINVPVVLAALVLTLRYVPQQDGDRRRTFDLPASAEILAGLVLVIFAVKEVFGVAPSYWLALLTGVPGLLLLVFFIRRQLRQTEPMIDFRLFNNPRFSNGFIIALVAMAGMVGIELVITQRLQLVDNFTPLQAGLHILPLPLAGLVAGLVAGVVAPRLGYRRTLYIALGLGAFAALGIALSAELPVWFLMVMLALLGLGDGVAMTLASTDVMYSAPAEKAGMAASLEEVSYEIGAVLGIALLGGLMTTVYMNAFSAPAGVVLPAAANGSIDAAMAMARSLPEAQGQLLADAAGSAFDLATQVVSLVAAVLMLSTLVVVWRLYRAGGKTERAVNAGHTSDSAA